MQPRASLQTPASFQAIPKLTAGLITLAPTLPTLSPAGTTLPTLSPIQLPRAAAPQKAAAARSPGRNKNAIAVRKSLITVERAAKKKPTTASRVHFDGAEQNIWAPIAALAVIVPASSIFHETGHWLAARLAKRPAEMRVSKVLVSDHDSLSYPAKITISAAGPAFNFILAGAAAATAVFGSVELLTEGVLWAYAGLNLYFGATNLIPLSSSRGTLMKVLGERGDTDGYNIRKAWRAWKKEQLRPQGLSAADLAADNRSASVPAQDYSDLEARLAKLKGSEEDRITLSQATRAVLEREEHYKALTSEELGRMTGKLRARIKRGESLSDVLPDAYAAAREVMARTLGKRPYVEQIAAAIGIHQGRVLQQKTGEGKTLSIGMAAYLNALSAPVDVYTFNSYLALRDADEIGRVFRMLGMTVGVLQGRDEAYLFQKGGARQRDSYERNFARVSRKEAYEGSDLIYGASRDYIFDHLFDQDADQSAGWKMKRREKSFAIVDEADAELLEEANSDYRIVSASKRGGVSYEYLSNLVSDWKEGEDFILDKRADKVRLTEASKSRLAMLKGIGSQFQNWKHLEMYARNALKAKFLLRLNKDYVVLKDTVIILDPHTGRLQFGRHWDGGLHRFVELKEGLKPDSDHRLSSHIALDGYLHLYGKLAGITGTLGTADAEFREVYDLQTIRIPSHRPSVRKDLPDRLFATYEAKLEAVVADALAARKAGRPALIGAKDLGESVRIAKMLDAANQAYSLLNGAQVESEKNIIARAGNPGAITVATQLAGRGTDIRPKLEALKAGGLHVILTGRASTVRVDLQYRGRAARQGEPGSSRVFLSLQDELVVKNATEDELAVLTLAASNEGPEVGSGKARRTLRRLQKRASNAQRRQRAEIRDKDKLLEPVRTRYFEMRARVFRGLAIPFARKHTLSMLHEGWGDFVAEYEDLWIDHGRSLSPQTIEARFEDLVLEPLRKSRNPIRWIPAVSNLAQERVQRFFKGSWYQKAYTWNARLLGKVIGSPWHRLWGNLALKMKRPRAASRHYKKLVSLRPQDALVRFRFAGALFESGQYESASAEYMKLLSLLWKRERNHSSREIEILRVTFKNLSASFHNTANAKIKEGDPLGGAANLRAAYLIDPWGEAKQAWEKIEESLSSEQKTAVSADLPFLKSVYLYRARQSVDRNNFKAAEIYFGRVLQLDPTTTTAWFGRAYTRKQMDDRGGVEKDFNEGLRLQVLSSRQFTNLRLLYTKMTSASLSPDALGPVFEALYLKPKTESAHPGDPGKKARRQAVSWYNDGIKAMQGKHYRAALSAFSNALSWDPGFSQAYDQRATAYFYLKRYRESFHDYADSLRFDLIDRDGKVSNLFAGSTTIFAWTPVAGTIDAFFAKLKEVADSAPPVQ